jgi:hypothetical protein
MRQHRKCLTRVRRFSQSPTLKTLIQPPSDGIFVVVEKRPCRRLCDFHRYVSFFGSTAKSGTVHSRPRVRNQNQTLLPLSRRKNAFFCSKCWSCRHAWSRIGLPITLIGAHQTREYTGPNLPHIRCSPKMSRYCRCLALFLAGVRGLYAVAEAGDFVLHFLDRLPARCLALVTIFQLSRQ